MQMLYNLTRLEFLTVLTKSTQIVQKSKRLGRLKAKIHYTSFPVQQVRNKLVRAKVRCVCCVVSFPKFHYNDLLPTCCGLVGRVANKSATSWRLLRLRRSYGETCVMDIGHNCTQYIILYKPVIVVWLGDTLAMVDFVTHMYPTSVQQRRYIVSLIYYAGA